jgi:hypothetical protein
MSTAVIRVGGDEDMQLVRKAVIASCARALKDCDELSNQEAGEADRCFRLMTNYCIKKPMNRRALIDTGIKDYPSAELHEGLDILSMRTCTCALL